MNVAEACRWTAGRQGNDFVHQYSKPENLIAERAHLVADIAIIEDGMRDMQALVATHHIARDHAETVLAQCGEEHRLLSDRLKLLDGSLASRR
jgi:hypothetical protein